VVRALDHVSFEIKAGQIMGLVGESGSGKSLTGFSIMGLLDAPGRIASGRILLADQDIRGMTAEQLRQMRGNRMAMIFQDPMMTLNPVMKISTQMIEAIEAHRPISKSEALNECRTALAMVGIASPDERLEAYPHQLSGGMRQRVMIAMALACNPKLLIADEPTTALDVTIQAQILDLMADLKHKIGAAIVLITHDLGVVAEVAERVMVMYAGRKVEEAPVGELFAKPLHPYTQGLLGAVPKLGASLQGHSTRLREIPGLVPSLKQKIKGCVFASRCPLAKAPCFEIAPATQVRSHGHQVACHFAGEIAFAND
jgi:peptide/nickel transport system ATP-binding protein